WVIYEWGVAAQQGLAGVIFGVSVLLAVFACVLLHELAHALVAIQHGLRVRDITLLPIGGVARVEHMRLSPKSEAVIALAGPAMNLAVAMALTPLVLIVVAIRHLDHPVSILLYASEVSLAGFILYLWIANLLLAVFNLIPAFPMDGGRVLRAALTQLRGRAEATSAAVMIGYVFAVLLTIGGLLVGDYLMPLVSIFIVVAAHMEANFVRLELALRRLPVGQFALWEAGGIRPDAPLAQAINGGPRDVAVTRDGVVVGMLWRHDLMRHLNGAHRDLFVRDIMDRRFNAVDVTDSVYDVHLWLATSNRPAVPVVENGVYRGIFTGDRLTHVYEHLNRHSFRWQRNLLGVLNRVRLAWR
ncbi:MAG: site-2 protease family protein, partial [Thermomicrobiales bacterium]